MTALEAGRHATLRDRLVDAAGELIAESGWAQVTMGKIADRVGVSRQTVYNEVGAKPQLAETVINAELERFLDLVSAAFDAYPHDLVKAVRKACRSVLERSCNNPVLVAVASATHGADTELLPYLTTHAGPLLEAAREVIRERVAAYDLPFTNRQVDATIDIVVRTVLSHIMQPSRSARATADDIAWVVSRVIASGGAGVDAEGHQDGAVLPRPRSGEEG